MTEPVVTPTPEKTSSRQMSFSILEDGTVRADFGPGLDPLTFQPGNPSHVPESLYPVALASGVIARLRGYTSRLIGEDRKPESLRTAVARGLADIAKGIWSAEREAGAGEISMEAEAAYVYRCKRAEAKGEKYDGTLEQAAADFAALTDDQKKTLKALPRYQLAYAEIKAKAQTAKAEKLAKKVNSEEEDSPF